MTERVKKFLQFHLQREYRKQRKTIQYTGCDTDVNEELRFVLNEETPLIYENDLFGFNRTITHLRNGCLGNFTPDYGWALNNGFNSIKSDLIARLHNTNEQNKRNFFSSAIQTIDMMFEFCERYKLAAKEQNNIALYQALQIVPHLPPQNYHQALVFMKILIYFLRSTRIDHLTLGRFDQYLYPFFSLSIAQGDTPQQLTELTELFFISLNMDTDLYTGIQQGDNGQSLVLGGRTLTSEDSYNELSEIVMTASEELRLIDPKINLRVNKNTTIERYIRATKLTQKGLGFPQYCNDDIVIEGLQKLGYDYEDAVDYSIAACWEFITPAGYDIPNVEAMNFPYIVRNATLAHLETSENFESFMQLVEKTIEEELVYIKQRANGAFSRWFPVENPFGCLFIPNCRKQGLTMQQGGAKYKNYGIHGLGIAPAADALAAIKKLVFDEKSVSPAHLIHALETDFQEDETLRKSLSNCPKMGNNDDYVDEIAKRMLAFFSDNLNNTPNEVGGIYRAGTGAPQLYIYGSQAVGATADGRHAGTPYPSSFSPALGIKTDGVLSVVQSFTKFDMTNTINGGPLTLEMHDNVFRNEDGIQKVAMLVKTFVSLGGHQLQLNAINRDVLLDAQKRPENYPTLIVRVWGWSGYFTELDLCFQNQIISRTEYML